MKKKLAKLFAAICLLCFVVLALVACNKPKTITFVVDGTTFAQVETDEEKTILFPSNPTKENYTFDGWYTTADGTKQWTQADAVTEDMTLYAKWVPISYTVTFEAEGKVVSMQKYTIENKNITEPAVPAKAGYTGVWEEYALTTGDVTVNAVYTITQYTVTFKADGNVVGTQTYTVENKNIVAPTVPAKTGYTGAWEQYTLTTGDVTVNAVYAKQYTVTLDYDDATGGNTQQTVIVTYNQAIGTLPVPTKTGYELLGWQHGDDIVTADTVWTTDGDATFVAQWRSVTEGLSYTLNANGNSYSVTGIGTATDTDIVIPSTHDGKPVTSIGSNAFYYCTSLTSVTIPNSVTRIESSAFNNCSNLEKINWNATACTSAGSSGSDYSIFKNCTKLTTVNIGDNVTTIPANAFYNCTSLASITFEENSQCTSIGYNTFYNCTSLTSVTIPNSVTNIDSNAFYYCTSLTIYCEAASQPSDWSSAWNHYADVNNVALYCPVVWDCDNNNKDKDGYEYAIIDGIRYSLKDNVATVVRQPINITEANIPEKVTYKGTDYAVTSIDNEVFADCRKLTSVTIPHSVTSIGDYAFYYCTSLTSITIPHSVTSIGQYAFDGCRSLTSITFEKNSQCISIGYHAFYYCTSLKSIAIPNSVTNIGEKAFSDCTSLTSVAIGKKVTSISSEAFYNCSSLASVSFEENSQCTSIGYKAFYDSKLTNITIPNSVTSIVNYAFDSCRWLTSIIIPNSVTSIGDYAFLSCRSLTIYCETASESSGWNSNWNSGNHPVVWDCNNNDKDKDGYAYTVVDGIRYSLKDNVATVVIQPINITRANIPNKVTYKDTAYAVTSIGEDAFDQCRSLTSISIPSSVTSIGQNAFSSCTSLTSITIPYCVTDIGYRAFKYCTSLKSVTIPNSVTHIGDEAFGNCRSLSKIYFSGTVAQFKNILKGRYWKEGALAKDVICSDGRV